MRRPRPRFPLLVLVLALSLSGCVRSGPPQDNRPRLVVAIVVDGLSERQLLQYRQQYLAGGLGRFLERGAHFTDANYGNSTTFTAPGHATILTGADPDAHGIVSNDWVDRTDFRPFYCIGDSEVTRLGDEAGRGVSPRSMLVETLGDSLLSSNPQSRVLGVAFKDRAAVLMGGKNGTAYFFSTNTGRFITTTYYRNDYPRWWQNFHRDQPQNAWFGSVWETLKPSESYDDAAPVDPDGNTPERGMGASFPHRLGSVSEAPDSAYYSELPQSPFGHDYLVQFVEAVVAGEQLGKRDGVTDLLSVSFSSHDYVNHSFGPESIESHDDILRLDVAVERLFQFLDREVGLAGVAFVLTADHGFPASPEYRVTQGLDGGRVDVPSIIKRLREHLDSRFSLAGAAVRWLTPGLFINEAVLAEQGLDKAEVETAAAAFLRQQEGVLAVLTRSQLEGPASSSSELETAVRRSWHPTRSGDLIVIPREGWYLHSRPWAYASMHGSPHSYDRHVPLIFLGEGFETGSYSEAVEVIDIVPTLARAMGISPPETAQGRVLTQALRVLEH